MKSFTAAIRPRKPCRPGPPAKDCCWKPGDYRECNLQKLEKVREAFEAAQPIGSDYVSEVRHACNPVTLQQGPFLSRYSGTLRIDVEGSYRIFTSSQDCSFLLIDDKLVIAAPGRHGPTGDARP